MTTAQTPAPDVAEIVRFFAQLYPDVEEGYLVLSRPDPDPAHVHPKTGKRWLRSEWLDLAQTSLARVAQIAATLSTQETVYFGVAIQRPDCQPDPAHRSTNAGASVVPGLWFDLDLAYGQHAASTLPATDGEALDFLATLPAAPSLIVHSGGGLYGYWLFKEPYRMTTDAAHETMRQLAAQFTYTVVDAGKHRGWTLDALGDLARVLRPPGTINFKYGTRVEVIHDSGARYNPGDFDWLLDLPEPARTTHAGAAITGQPDLITVAEHYGTTLERKSTTELAGAHPQHGSSTGDNFNVNVSKGLWHCWRHGTGGDGLSLIAVCEDLVPCEDMRTGALKGKVFTQVVSIANKTFQAGIVLDAVKRSNGTAPASAFTLAAFLAKLQATEPEGRLHAVLTAIADLSMVPLADWIGAKRTLKAQVPALNLNDLERLRTHALQDARREAARDARADLPTWQQALFLTKEGDVQETDNNLQAIFAHHRFWQGRLWWDVVANRAYLDDRQPLDIHYVRNEVSPWLGTELRMPIRHSTRVLEVMRSWAQRQPRDPIQEWLATLPEKDETDLKRTLLNTFLHRYAGAEDTPYTRFVSRILIASMVQRAMVPGVQYRYVVVLEGEENLGKTKLLRLLGDRWHQEFPKSVEGKEAYMQLQGYWLVELGELDALKPAQESRIKMFISQQMDVWVPKYENDVLERPRRAILVGTTNEREYLKGEHGNTRYLPVWLDGPIDHAVIAKVRDRLFTQAKHFLADHPDDWWAIPEDVVTEVMREREARKEPSVFEDALRPFLLNRQQCTVSEVLEEALQIPQAQWSKRLEMEVAKAFKDLGWYRHIERDATTKKVRRFWAATPQQREEVPF